ncbi:cyclin, partial [Aspergillus novofumigatus IBT 16806]
MASEKKDDPTQPAGTDPSLPEPPAIHPSFIQVAKPYIFEQTIQKCIAAMGVNPLREEALRLQGVTWIDNVRRALYLPIRTFNTAVVYYHRFRLIHPDTEYNYMDAAAAALFTACKIEDTLKKSREIVCAAYNLKLPPSEHMSPDNPVFEAHARGIIGLERLMLEASGFDFRTRHPQKTLIKLARHYGLSPQSEVSNLAYRISQDLYRTFAPIKQTTSTMAFCCLELAGRLLDQRLEPVEQGSDYEQWRTSREEVMDQTLFDLLELYTHNRSSTTVGHTSHSDRFLTVRIPLNKEAEPRNYVGTRTGSKTAEIPSATNWREDGRDRHAPKDRDDMRRERRQSSRARGAPTLPPVAANGERPKPGTRSGRGCGASCLIRSAQRREARVAEYFKDRNGRST